jgi:hypothetical protein
MFMCMCMSSPKSEVYVLCVLSLLHRLRLPCPTTCVWSSACRAQVSHGYITLKVLCNPPGLVTHDL